MLQKRRGRAIERQGFEMVKPMQKVGGNAEHIRGIGRHQDTGGSLHPAWLAFIRHCQELGFGEISQLKVQDGLPVMAEETKRKVKFL